MASPTEADIRTGISNTINVFEKIDGFLRTDTTNLNDLYEAVVLAPEGDWAANVVASMDGHRALAADLVTPARVRAALGGQWRAYGKVLGFAEETAEDILVRLQEDFAGRGTPLTVKERNFSFGTPAADGGNTGDGTLHRLNIDQFGYEIEAQTPDAKEFQCIADRYSGATIHQERFEIRGSDPPRDLLAGEKSEQRTGAIQALSADDSDAWLQNPSFADWVGTSITSLTSIPGWTPATDIGNFDLDESETYRTADLEGASPRSVVFNASDTLSQSFLVQGQPLSPGTPYFLQIAWMRKSSATGTLKLRLGSREVTADIGAATNDAWNVLTIGLTTNNWHRNFNQDDLTVEIEADTLAVGTIKVDDVVFGAMTQHDGAYYALVGGATPHLRLDKFTFTDSISTDSVIQKWLWRGYGFWFPSAASPVWADPS